LSRRNHRCLRISPLFWAFLAAMAFLGIPLPASADCAKPEGLYEWINCRIPDALAARMNIRANKGQVEAPSSASNTTSLVDQSTASDLLGAALNLAALATKSPGGNASTFSGVGSAYAIKAAIDKHDPLDPRYYTDNRSFRNLWFTLGAQYPDAKSPPNAKPATLAGMKVLLVNQRDLSAPANRKKILNLIEKSGAANVAFNATDLAVEKYLYDRFSSTVAFPPDLCKQNGADLPPDKCDLLKRAHFKIGLWTGADKLAASVSNLLRDDDLKKIDQIIVDQSAPILEFLQTTSDTVDSIRKAPQLSANFQSTIRSGSANNAYRAELAFDYGLANRLNLSVNASYDYDDLRPTGVIQRGGRFALEGQYAFGSGVQLQSKEPWTFSLSSQGSWMTSISPTYEAQAKLTIPIADGVDFPISVSYASRTALIKEADVRGKFGFTFDLSKVLNAVRGSSKQ
jgi:hypothetical protein